MKEVGDRLLDVHPTYRALGIALGIALDIVLDIALSIALAILRSLWHSQ